MFARLHERLDRGEDPFDDAVLVAWLDAHPEHLERAVQLRADALALALVQGHAAPRPRPAHRLRWALAAAGVLVALGLLLQSRAPIPTAARPRIISAQFEERRPPALAAASFRVHDARYASATASFESYTLRSERQ